jgi:hypothetical protein
MYKNIYTPFVDDIFDSIFNKKSNVKTFSVDLSDLQKVLDELLKANTPNQKNDMITKKPILPQHDSKYRVVKRTANNKTQYFVEFSNPTRVGEPVFQPVPGRFTFDTIEEAKEQIAFYKKQTAVSEEIIYEE